MNTDREAHEPPRPPRRVLLLAVVAAVAYVVDVLTKVVATAGLEGEEPVRILGGAVYLQLLRNPYAAFGMDFGGTWLLALVAIIVVGAIIWFARKLRSTGWAIGLGLILAGALGNLTDRLFRAPGPMQGHVVDFVSVFGPDGRYFPVFNAADSAITVGAILIVLLTFLGRDYDGTITRGPKKNVDDDNENDSDGDSADASADTDTSENDTSGRSS
ncbi:signal peptidase II [Saccharomonospora sp. CUA-673]|uniref:signal peptidase II n=1 Tax=Saccharomonospora sp. CUA-673 TaxID=1904969 RepID=UPI000A7D2637|nr:signal peptidase II [Saccharomonospora sp. CUA-673]